MATEPGRARGDAPVLVAATPALLTPARLVVALALALVAVTLPLLSCSGGTRDTVLAGRCDRLVSGTTYVADLDNDETLELILVEDARLTVRDGDFVYHSRDKWEVVDASLGDVDGDGFLEVVSLLDDQEGRHVGLFAFFGGEYRERLVTSELPTEPGALHVCNSACPGIYEGLIPAGFPGDLVVLTGRTGEPDGEPPTVLRWNGFSFTEITPGTLVTEP